MPISPKLRGRLALPEGHRRMHGASKPKAAGWTGEQILKMLYDQDKTTGRDTAGGDVLQIRDDKQV
jgi:hypothetical protein